MKTGYVLIDLNSLVIYLENDSGQFEPSINTKILILLKNLQSKIDNKEIKLRIILFSFNNHLRLSSLSKDSSDLYFFKNDLLTSGFAYSDIITHFKKFCRSFNLSDIKLFTLKPYLIPVNDGSITKFDLMEFSKYIKTSQLNLTDLLVISANSVFLDHLNESEIGTINTYRDGDIDINELNNLNILLKSTHHPRIHWFVDIDQTLLLRQETKLLSRTFLNNSLVNIIKATSKYDSLMRISVLTARTNPCDQFEKLATKLVTLLELCQIENPSLLTLLIVSEARNAYEVMGHSQAIIKHLDDLLNNNQYVLDIQHKLEEIRKEFSNYYNSTASLSLLLVEAVKASFLDESGLDLSIESFSYVDTRVKSKAHVIQSTKQGRQNVLENENHEIIIFAEDNAQELNAAYEMRLAIANSQFTVLPIKSDGDLELDHEKKINDFMTKLVAQSKKNKNQKSDIPPNFWKKQRKDEKENHCLEKILDLSPFKS